MTDYTDSYERLVAITTKTLYPWFKVVYSDPEKTSRKVAEDIVDQVLAELT
jgi:polyphosphate kinase 2 (PPK2 family)